MRCFKIYPSCRSILLLPVAMLCVGWASGVEAASWSLPSVKDNTLYEYDPADYVPGDPDTGLMSNGSGDFFSAGRNRKRSEIRRGLIQFDFSAIPSGAAVVEGSARLDLYVVDVPTNDPAPRPVWMVPLPALAQSWGEGASATEAGVSGAGSGAPAQLGDATWFHTAYDPASHDQTTFTPGGAGFWSQEAALGSAPLDPWSTYGAAIATLESLNGPAFLSSGGMESDITAWIQGTAANFGWIVLGDETVEGDKVSSNRGFATREHALEEFRPVLSFETVVGPIPAMAWDGGIGEWSQAKWNGTNSPILNADVTIDAAGSDSFVEVTAGGTTGPAIHLTVGAVGSVTEHAELAVRGGNTLEVLGTTTADQFGTIAIDANATLQTGTALIDAGGRLRSGVQGDQCGLLETRCRLGLEEADSVQVEWLPLESGTPAEREAAMFGGIYTIATYTGDTAFDGTDNTANEDANIGAAYVKEVVYDADYGDGIKAVTIELYPQGVGDADLDGSVGPADLAIFGLAWNPTGVDKTWFDGDFDFDGAVGPADLAAFGLAWAPNGIDFSAETADVTTVPEPGTVSLLLLAAAVLLVCGKRR